MAVRSAEFRPDDVYFWEDIRGCQPSVLPGSSEGYPPEDKTSPTLIPHHLLVLE